jgi:regulator of replication initiation timing
MKRTKIKTLALCAAIALSLFCFGAFAFTRPYAVRAEETEPPAAEQEQQAVEPQDRGDGGFTALFNEKILPLIIGAGSTVIGFLFIALKDTFGKRKMKHELETLKEAYKQLFGRNEVFSLENEKLRAAAGQVDYTNIIKDLIEKTVGEKLRLYDKEFAEIGVNQKAQNEQFAAFLKAAQAVWGAKIPAAAAALNTLPSVRTLKKYELENALLKDKIAEIKGGEADKVIASVAAAAEARV